jgi:hypothetical protein
MKQKATSCQVSSPQLMCRLIRESGDKKVLISFETLSFETSENFGLKKSLSEWQFGANNIHL